MKTLSWLICCSMMKPQSFSLRKHQASCAEQAVNASWLYLKFEFIFSMGRWLVGLSAIVVQSLASYVIVRPTVPRCFAESIPADIPVAITYRIPAFHARNHPLPSTGLEIEVTNPQNDVLDIHYITSERGRYEFSSTDTELGLHEICFHTNASKIGRAHV